jgi:hypothetical protein
MVHVGKEKEECSANIEEEDGNGIDSLVLLAEF